MILVGALHFTLEKSSMQVLDSSCCKQYLEYLFATMNCAMYLK